MDGFHISRATVCLYYLFLPIAIDRSQTGTFANIQTRPIMSKTLKGSHAMLVWLHDVCSLTVGKKIAVVAQQPQGRRKVAVHTCETVARQLHEVTKYPHDSKELQK